MQFCGPLCTAFYDADKPSAPYDAVSYYLHRARQASGPVLEPMCGSGRYLLPLMRAGVDIDGVDAAPAMLQACRQHALLESLQPTLYLQALEEPTLPRKYVLAFVPSGSIGLLAEPALRAALCRLRQHLEPGASLLIELQDPSAGRSCQESPEHRVVPLGEEFSITYNCRSELASDGESITYHGRYEKRRGSTLLAIEVESLSLYLHKPRRFAALLAECGFHPVINRGCSQYTSLHASGCILMEAQAGAPAGRSSSSAVAGR